MVESPQKRGLENGREKENKNEAQDEEKAFMVSIIGVTREIIGFLGPGSGLRVY